MNSCTHAIFVLNSPDMGYRSHSEEGHSVPLFSILTVAGQDLLLRIHPPLQHDPKAQEDQQHFSAQLTLPPLHPLPPSAMWHSHLCRPCQMVQGVLGVQEGLVVLLSERIGGMKRKKGYFSIRMNTQAK